MAAIKTIMPIGQAEPIPKKHESLSAEAKPRKRRPESRFEESEEKGADKSDVGDSLSKPPIIDEYA